MTGVSGSMRGVRPPARGRDLGEFADELIGGAALGLGLGDKDGLAGGQRLRE
jgi:hypothetical protein